MMSHSSGGDFGAHYHKTAKPMRIDAICVLLLYVLHHITQVDISELIITKQLNKTEDNMKVMMAHVVLAKKMKDRDPNTAPVCRHANTYVRDSSYQ